MDSCCESPFLKQAWVISSVLISIVAQGVVLGYTSCLLPALGAPDSPIQTDLHRASWIASSLGPACVVGQVISCFLIEIYGRRTTFLLAAAPGVSGWLLIYSAQSYTILLTGRILTGLGSGFTIGFGAVIIGEYTSPKYRGMFLNLKIASINIGSTIVHVLGNYKDWRTIALYALVPYVLSFLITCTWPESPAWLASKRRYEQCERDFFKLRGRSKSAAWEVEELIRAQKERLSSVQENTSIAENIVDFFKKFTQKDFLKPAFISFLAFLLIEACGRHFFPAFASQFINGITGTSMQQQHYILIIDLVITGSALTSAVLVTMVRRRVLLFSSGISGLLVLIPACVCLYLTTKGVLSTDYQVVPIYLLVVYFILVNLGCTPVPMALQGEIFPTHHRSVGLGVSSCLTLIMLSGILYTIPFLLIHLKVCGVLALFAVIMASALVGLFFTLPETKDRTLQEIEDYFQNGRFGTRRASKEDHLKMVSSDET